MCCLTGAFVCAMEKSASEVVIKTNDGKFVVLSKAVACVSHTLESLMSDTSNALSEPIKRDISSASLKNLRTHMEKIALLREQGRDPRPLLDLEVIRELLIVDLADLIKSAAILDVPLILELAQKYFIEKLRADSKLNCTVAAGRVDFSHFGFSGDISRYLGSAILANTHWSEYIRFLAYKRLGTGFFAYMNEMLCVTPDNKKVIVKDSSSCALIDVETGDFETLLSYGTGFLSKMLAGDVPAEILGAEATFSHAGGFILLKCTSNDATNICDSVYSYDVLSQACVPLITKHAAGLWAICDGHGHVYIKTGTGGLYRFTLYDSELPSTLFTGGRMTNGVNHNDCYKFCINPTTTLVADYEQIQNDSPNRRLIRVWDTKTCQLVYEFVVPAQMIFFHFLNEQKLVGWWSDGTCSCWDMKTGMREVRQLEAYLIMFRTSARELAVCFAPDGRLLTFNLASLTVVCTFEPAGFVPTLNWTMQQRARCIAQSDLFVALSADKKKLLFWNYKTGRKMGVLHNEEVILEFLVSNDGNMIFTRSENEVMKVWYCFDPDFISKLRMGLSLEQAYMLYSAQAPQALDGQQVINRTFKPHSALSQEFIDATHKSLDVRIKEVLKAKRVRSE